MKCRKVNHLRGFLAKVGQLLILGELGHKPLPHILVRAGLLLGTGLDRLELGQQISSVLKHAHVFLHIRIGQILGGPGLLGGAAGLAGDRQAGEVGAELLQQLVFLGMGIAGGGLESLAYNQRVIDEVNLVGAIHV